MRKVCAKCPIYAVRVFISLCVIFNLYIIKSDIKRAILQPVLVSSYFYLYLLK